MYIDFSPSLQFGQVGCPDWSTEASGTLHMIDTRAKSDGIQTTDMYRAHLLHVCTLVQSNVSHQLGYGQGRECADFSGPSNTATPHALLPVIH